MDSIITDEQKQIISEQCNKLKLYAGLLGESQVRTSCLLGGELQEIADVIVDELNACLPEGVD